MFLSLLEAKWESGRDGKSRFCLRPSFIDLTVLSHSTETKENYAAEAEKWRIDESFTSKASFPSASLFRLHTSFARAACLGT